MTTKEQKQIKLLLNDYSLAFYDWKLVKERLDYFEPEPGDYQEMYCEWIDKNHDCEDITYKKYTPSQILKKSDPTRFWNGLREFTMSEFQRDRSTCEEYSDLEEEISDLEKELKIYKKELKSLGYEVKKLGKVSR